MKKVRINNEITNILKSTIVTLFIICIVLLLLCISFTHVFITYGIYSDDELKIVLILIIVSLIITLALFTGITVKTIIKRKDELRYNYQTKIIKYVEFSNEGITVCYNDNAMFNVVYEDINEMKLTLKTKNTYSYINFPRIYRIIGITGMDLQLKYNYNKVSESFKINIPAGFTLLDKIFEIVHFSQYISKFSYKSSAMHEEKLQKTLGKAIESYKANNYRHTLRSFGYTMWAFPTLIIIVILLLIALFFAGLCI